MYILASSLVIGFMYMEVLQQEAVRWRASSVLALVESRCCLSRREMMC